MYLVFVKNVSVAFFRLKNKNIVSVTDILSRTENHGLLTCSFILHGHVHNVYKTLQLKNY